MEDVIITRATIADLHRLQEISIRTFSETFASANSAENMQKYLREKFSLEKLSDELNNPDAEFYFASFNSDIIGYLKLNSGTSQTELKDGPGLEIERIYVAKEYHGKKVAQLLFQKALEAAASRRADYIWLGVWDQNERAIAFYKKNGFVEFDQHIFKLGDEEQTDIMMKLDLKP